MFGPEPIFENSGFYLDIMTSIFWDFEKEIWYDPSAKQEVMPKLWLNDGEFLYDGWKNYPPVQGITNTALDRPSLTSDLGPFVEKFRSPKSQTK